MEQPWRNQTQSPMITESRQIYFNRIALMNACRWYASVPKQTDLPYGMITDVLLNEEVPLSLTVLVEQAGASRIRIVKLPEGKILPIILYVCKKHKVPIPRHAEKSFKIIGDELVLVIHRTLATAAP